MWPKFFFFTICGHLTIIPYVLAEHSVPDSVLLCSYNEHHSSGNLIWSMAVRIHVHSATRAFVSSGNDVE